MCNEAAAAVATVLEKRQRRPCLLSSLRRNETSASSASRLRPRAGLGGPGAWGGQGDAVGGVGPAWGSQAAPAALPARARSELLTSPRRTCKLPEGVCVCARAGGQAREGGAGGAARPPRRLPGRWRGRLLPRGFLSARPNLASRELAPRRRAAHLEGARGGGRGGPAPVLRVPAHPPHTKQSPERKSGPSRTPPSPRPDARRTPRTQHQPRAPTYLGEGSRRSARRVRGKLRRRFPRFQLGARLPPRLPVPGLGHPTPVSTAPAPGPAGRTGLLPAAPGKGGRGGGASLHGLSPDAAAPGPGPAARTGPQGGSESAKCLVGARGGRRGRGGGCRGSARLGRRGKARAMLRMFGMRTGMK